MICEIRSGLLHTVKSEFDVCQVSRVVDRSHGSLLHELTVDVVGLDESAESVEIGQFEFCYVRIVRMFEKERLAVATVL